MQSLDPYTDFKKRLKLFISKHPELIVITLSNIFTMRLIGNKTHGDLAEIAISEFINQYMYDFRSVHVGKDLYRAKSREEDIKVFNEINETEFPVSLKAYGDGPLQLSTDKAFGMFPRLEQEGEGVSGKRKVRKVLDDPAFSNFTDTNVLPLIYDEAKQRCNILVFEYERAVSEAHHIRRVAGGGGGGEYTPCTDSSTRLTSICLKSDMGAPQRTRSSAGCGRTRRTAFRTSRALRVAGLTTRTIWYW